MKKEVTEIIFILDRSGSMTGLETETIKGFNRMLSKQKKSKEKHLFQRCFLMMNTNCYIIEFP